VRRISVVGNSGSGKTTVAKALAARLGVPHVELDAIFHQPNWTPLPADEFRRRVADAITGDGPNTGTWLSSGWAPQLTSTGFCARCEMAGGLRLCLRQQSPVRAGHGLAQVNRHGDPVFRGVVSIVDQQLHGQLSHVVVRQRDAGQCRS
jgi:ABC-type dipeptide/oligopeptide/nickel transport system ATPase component